MIAALLVAGIAVAAPAQLGTVAAQEADQPVSVAQIGGRAYVPIIQDPPQGTANATVWLRLSSPSVGPGGYFGMKILTKSIGTAPEPFVNAFISYDTSLVDFQSATTVRGDFVSTQRGGLSVRFNGPFAPGAERYVDILFKARAGVNNRDVQFGGSFDAAAGKAGSVPNVTFHIGTSQNGIRPSVRYACEFNRGGSGPLGQNPGAGNNPFGTQYFFGAFRRDNGGCGFTFSPGARVSYWIAQPTGPSVPLGFYGKADSFGEVEVRYSTTPLLNVCPVNLCAFAMNASSDGKYVLVAPFNLSRTGARAEPDAAPAQIAETAQVGPAQIATGGLSGVVTGADGSLLREVLVVAVDPATDEVVRTALTDAAGQYVIPSGIPTGSLQVHFITSLGHNIANAEYVDEASTVATLDAQVTALNATLDPGGTISGRVTNDAGQPLQELVVLIYDATQTNIVSAALTDANGAYTSDALASGNYIVEFQASTSGFDPSAGHVGEYHENQPLGTPPAPITVTAPADTTSVDGTLSRCPTCGAIDGRVTAQDGGAALPDVTVVVRDTATNQQVAIEQTDEDGRYHALVPSGNYSVEFFTDVSPSLLSRSYSDAYAAPSSIAVTAPAVVANINGVLARGGQIAGAVTAQDGGAPLPGVFVVVTNAQQQVATTTFTDDQGRYSTPALTNGSYTVTFQTAQADSELTRGYKDASRAAVVTGPGSRGAPTDIQLGR